MWTVPWSLAAHNNEESELKFKLQIKNNKAMIIEWQKATIQISSLLPVNGGGLSTTPQFANESSWRCVEYSYQCSLKEKLVNKDIEWLFIGQFLPFPRLWLDECLASWGRDKIRRPGVPGSRRAAFLSWQDRWVAPDQPCDQAGLIANWYCWDRDCIGRRDSGRFRIRAIVAGSE